MDGHPPAVPLQGGRLVSLPCPMREAALIGLGSSAAPLCRAFDGPLLAVRLPGCAAIAAIGWRCRAPAPGCTACCCRWPASPRAGCSGMGFGGHVAAAAFAPGGQAIAIGGESGEVVLWSPVSSARTPHNKLDSGALSVAFSPDGQR